MLNLHWRHHSGGLDLKSFGLMRRAAGLIKMPHNDFSYHILVKSVPLFSAVDDSMVSTTSVRIGVIER